MQAVINKHMNLFSIKPLLLILLLSLNSTAGMSGEVADEEPYITLDTEQVVSRLLTNAEKKTLNFNENKRLELPYHYDLKLIDNKYTLYTGKGLHKGDITGGIIVARLDFMGGYITLLVGLNEELRISKTAIVSISKQLKDQFENTTGTGYLTRFTMMSIRQLAYVAKVTKKEGPEKQLVGEGVHLLALLLKYDLTGIQTKPITNNIISH